MKLLPKVINKTGFGIIGLIVFFTGCSGPQVESPADLSPFMQQTVKSNQVPGISYIAVSAKKTLTAKSAGWADVESAKPLSQDTVLMAYSMSKTFTAIAALQLAERGKLDLDAPATQYLPDLPYPNSLKIRHLLAQTSGLPNPIPLRWVHLPSEESQFDERAEFQSVIEENSELDFAPGEKYAYSNISYWLLGRIIETVAGQPFALVMQQNLFAPLGLSPREIGYRFQDNQPVAKGYLARFSMMNAIIGFLVDKKFLGEKEGQWRHIRPHYLNSPAFGGLIATPRAIGIVLQDLLQQNSVLLGTKGKQWLFEEQQDNQGKPVAMTLGFHIGRRKNGKRFYFKEGGGAGFHCEMRLYPDQGMGSVVMSNGTRFDVKGFLDAADSGQLTVVYP